MPEREKPFIHLTSPDQPRKLFFQQAPLANFLDFLGNYNQQQRLDIRLLTKVPMRVMIGGNQPEPEKTWAVFSDQPMVLNGTSIERVPDMPESTYYGYLRSYPGQDWVEVTIQSPLGAKEMRAALAEHGVGETEGRARITVDQAYREK